MIARTTHGFLLLLLVALAAGQGCELHGSDTIEIKKDGEEWAARCGTCTCKSGEIQCTVEEGKSCGESYSPELDAFCVEWDADGCCCLTRGCEVDGRVVPLGQNYTTTADGCTKYCSCSIYTPGCFSTVCVA